MRVVLIHRGPSDTCPCDLCHADVALHPEAFVQFEEGSMVTTKCDQGRDTAYVDGAPVGGAIGGMLAAVAIIALVIGAGLGVGAVIEWWSK